MKIAVIVNQYPVFSETFLYTLFNNLSRHGFAVTVLSRNCKHGKNFPMQQFRFKPLLNEGNHPAIKIAWLIMVWIELVIKNPRLALKWLRYIVTLSITIREKFQVSYRCVAILVENTDIVYFSFGGLAALYLELIRFMPEQCYFSLRGSDIHIDTLVDGYDRQRLREATQLAAGVHCVCEEIRERAVSLVGHPLLNARVIYTALNEDFLTAPMKQVLGNQPNEPLRIVSIGRLDWRKGFEYGLLAVKALRESGLNLEWHIYGEGPYRTCLEYTLRDLELKGVVFLHGKIDHQAVVKELHEMDVYFLCSVCEGINNSGLEAMALGLPIVSTRVGGMLEAIHDEETGLLVPPRDWRSMVCSMERLGRSPELRSRLGAAGSKYVRNKFTSEKQVEGFMEFFGVVR